MPNYDDIDLGEYYSEDEEAGDYYQDHKYREHTRELDGKFTWDNDELTWGEE